MTYRFPGPITMDNAEASLVACVAAIDAGEDDVELAALTRSDSSAVAVLVAARRHAASSGRRVQFRAMPEAVGTLVRLYGLDELVAGANAPPR